MQIFLASVGLMLCSTFASLQEAELDKPQQKLPDECIKIMGKDECYQNENEPGHLKLNKICCQDYSQMDFHCQIAYTNGERRIRFACLPKTTVPKNMSGRICEYETTSPSFCQFPPEEDRYEPETVSWKIIYPHGSKEKTVCELEEDKEEVFNAVGVDRICACKIGFKTIDVNEDYCERMVCPVGTSPARNLTLARKGMNNITYYCHDDI